MPSCFQLFRKDEDSFTAVPLERVDEELCEHFDVPVDPEKYYWDWYGAIGSRLAMGRTFAQIKAEFEQHRADGQRYYVRALEVLDYLMERYTTHAFYQPKY